MKQFSGISNINTMSKEEKKELLLVTVLFLFFSAAAVFSIMNFMWLNNIPQSEVTAEVPTPAVTGGVNKVVKIEELVPKYDAYIKSRNYSGQLVMLAEAVDRVPITDAESVFAKLAANAPENFEIPEIVPILTIKALVIMEGNGVAALDIEGERPGLIARKGYVFGGGKGKITSIDAGGVNWKWANKKYRTDL